MFLSSLLKCVPLRFGLPPHFHVIQKKKKKKGLSKIQALPIWKRENPPWNTFKSNITALGAVCCVSEFFCVFFFFCIFVDTQPNVNETSGYFQHEYSKVWQQNIIQLSEKYQQQTSSFDLSPSEMKAVGFFFSGVVILHQCWNHTREERLFFLQTIPITSSTLETTTWRRGYVRQAEGKWTNRRGKKKRLSLGNANPQFFSFLLIVVWRGWIGILLGREVTSTDDWQFSYSLKHHRLRLIGRGARLSELHWLYETRRPPWKPLFRYQNTFLRKLEAKLLHYSETQATIFWGLVIIKIWMKLENSRP